MTLYTAANDDHCSAVLAPSDTYKPMPLKRRSTISYLIVALITLASTFYATSGHSGIVPIGAVEATIEVGTTKTFGVSPRINVQGRVPEVVWGVEGNDPSVIMLPATNDPYTQSFRFTEVGTYVITVIDVADLVDTGPNGTPPRNSSTEFMTIVVDNNNTATSQQPNSGEPPTPLNPNQRNVQTVLDQTCNNLSNNTSTSASDDLRSTCDTLTMQSDLVASYDRIAAEEIITITDTLTYTAYHQISNIQSRIDAVRAGQQEAFDIRDLSLQLWGQTIGGNILNAGAQALMGDSGDSQSSSTAKKSAISDSAIAVFASGKLTLGDRDGDDIQRNTSMSTTSLTIGADYRLDNTRVLGAALSIVNDETTFDNENGGGSQNGSLDMQGFGLTAFGTWYEQDKGYADFILDISQNDFSLARRIDLPGQTTEYANSSTNSQRVAFSISAGRTFQRAATEFGPIFRVAIMRASVDGFRERSSLASGGAGTALDVDSQTVSSSRFSIGGEIKHAINTTKAVFVPAAKLELEVENKTDKGVITASFVNDPDAERLDIRGAERDNTAMKLSLGTTAVLRHGQSASLLYESRLLDDRVNQHSISVGYRMHF